MIKIIVEVNCDVRLNGCDDGLFIYFDFNDTRIKQKVEEEMQSHGYVKSSEGKITCPNCYGK